MIKLEHIEVCVDENVAHASLNRPDKANALNHKLWFEIEALAEWAAATPEVRVLVLSGKGRHFCAGIDFGLIQRMMTNYSQKSDGNRQEWLVHEIQKLQRAFSALESCPKPVIAAVNGTCFGGGIDLITACDMRFCVDSARFCVKEIDLAIVADIGTLQRLPGIVGEGHAREMAMTAKIVEGPEAEKIGLVNRSFSDAETMYSAVTEKAKIIASKSPLAMRNTKKVLNYSRDKSVAEGLEYVATLNAGILFSADATEAFQATMQKRKPNFKN